MMAANWWKYGLVFFAGAGVGYLAHAVTVKDKYEKIKAEEVAEIRQLYRQEKAENRAAEKKAKQQNEDYAAKPSKARHVEETSISNTYKLSDKKAKAEQAQHKYGAAFEKPGEPEDGEDIIPEPVEPKKEDYIHVVEEFDQDSEYDERSLYLHSDGEVSEVTTGRHFEGKELDEMVGIENVEKLKNSDIYDMYIVNDLYKANYVLMYNPEPYSAIAAEEPYKAEL